MYSAKKKKLRTCQVVPVITSLMTVDKWSFQSGHSKGWENRNIHFINTGVLNKQFINPPEIVQSQFWSK